MNTLLAFSVETIRKLCVLSTEITTLRVTRRLFFFVRSMVFLSLAQNGFRNPDCLMGIIIVFKKKVRAEG